MNNRMKTIVGIAVAALLLFTLYLIYINVFVNKHRLKLEHRETGGQEYRNIAAESSIMPSYMWRRIKDMLIGGDYIMSDNMIEGRLATQTAEPSGKYYLTDQSLLLLKYIAEGDRGSSRSLVKAINSDFRNDDGSYRGVLYKDGTVDKSYTNNDEMSFLEAYVEYYSAFGSKEDLENINKLIDLLFDSNGEMKPEKLKSALYVSSENVSGEISDDELVPSFDHIYGDEDLKGEVFEYEGVRICDINLELIKNLENNGLIAAGAFDRMSKIVKESVASEDIPYYAYAYRKNENGEIAYNYSYSRAASISVELSVRTMINLARAGLLDQGVYNQFKLNMINDGYLRSNFYIATGLTGGSEIPGSYCDALLLARLQEDTELYKTVCRIMSVRIATSQKSKAIYMVFREENSRYRFYADENLKLFLITKGMFAV